MYAGTWANIKQIVSGPDRVFVDLAATSVNDSVPAVLAALKGKLITSVRLGYPVDGTTRVVMTLADFEKISARMKSQGVTFINEPSVTQQGSVREQMLMTVSDGCGNAIEFKGLHNIADVYAVKAGEAAMA